MTVVIAPSRRLRCLLAGFGASLLAAACAAGLPAFAAFTGSAGFAGGPAVAAALLFAGACVTHAALVPAMVHRIDISGLGQLRLTVQQGVRTDACEALPARLLPGSTLWPRLMVLRLETVRGPVADTAPKGVRGWVCARVRVRRGVACRSLAVLPDSLPPEAMRALTVALGGAGGAGGATSTTHKIL